MDNCVLHVYKGEWGLASIDLESLKQMALCKFANAAVEFNFTGRVFLSPTGFLPYCSVNSKKLKSYHELTDYLKTHNFDPNQHLSSSDKALSISYQQLIATSLHPYYMLTLFHDDNNFQIIRNLYGERIGFPFSLFYPNKYQKLANTIKELTYGCDTDEPNAQEAMQKSVIEARIFLNNISTQLGRKAFIFGDKPCEFDAHLYAYLALLYHATVPNNTIQAHISQCPNLMTYVKRITKTYFQKEAFNSGRVYDFSMYGKSAEDGAATGADGTKKQKILAGLFAVGMMAAFAFTSGILSRQRQLDYYESGIDDAAEGAANNDDNDDDD